MIDDTFIQAANEREDSKFHSKAASVKDNRNSWLVRGKESHRFKTHHFSFYKTNNKPKGKKSSIKSTNKKDMHCFIFHKDGLVA